MEIVLTDSVSVVHERSNVQMTEVMTGCDTLSVRVKPHHGSELILSQLMKLLMTVFLRELVMSMP